jgi:hypothetical protein
MHSAIFAIMFRAFITFASFRCLRCLMPLSPFRRRRHAAHFVLPFALIRHIFATHASAIAATFSLFAAAFCY